MISIQQAGAQAVRFAALKYFNTLADEGRAELLNTLATCSVDERHAKAIVDQWLSEESDIPSPADLRRLANACRPADTGGTARPDPHCESCHGSGFATAWYLATMQGVHYQPRFEWLAALDPTGRTPPEVAEMQDRLTRKGIHNQQVVTAAGRCKACGYGRSLELARQAAQHAEPEPKRQRGQQSGFTKASAVQHYA